MALTSASAWSSARTPARTSAIRSNSASRKLDDVRNENFANRKNDNWSPHYAALADDSTTEAKKREASMLFCACEKSVDEEDVGEALRSGWIALPLFRDIRDAKGEHDTLRAIIHAQRLEANLDYRDFSEEAEQLAKESLSEFEVAGDGRGQAAMLLSLAECLCDRRLVKPSELEQANEWLKRALTSFRDVGDNKMEAIALLELAHVFAIRGSPDDVHESTMQSVSLFKAAGDEKGEARALHGVAIALAMQRRLPEALERMRESLSTYRKLGDKKHEAFELCVLAELHLEEERPNKALPVAKEALAIFRELEYGRGWEATSLHAVVRSFMGRQQPEMAVKCARDGLERLRGQTEKRQEIFGYEILSDALLNDPASHPSQALDECRKAQIAAAGLEDRRPELGVAHATMWAYCNIGDLNRAVDSMNEARCLARELKDEQEEAVSVYNLAFLYAERGEHKRAVEAAEAARTLFIHAEDKKGEGGALLLVAACFGLQDKTRQAIDNSVLAQDIFIQSGDLRGEHDASLALSNFQLQVEDVQEASTAAEHAVEVAEKYANKRLQAAALRQLARCQLAADNTSQAERSLLKAKEVALAAEDRAELTLAQMQLTDVYLALCDDCESPEKSPHLERAMRSSAEAVSLSSRCNVRGLVASARFARAQLLRATQTRAEEASRTAEEAIRWFRKAGDLHGEARTLILQGCIAMDQQKREEAHSFAEEAKSIAVDIGSAHVEREANSLLKQLEEKPVVTAKTTAEVSPQQPAIENTQAEAAQSIEKPAPKGLDPTYVKQKVMELTRNLLASDDDLEDDSPFMDAGMDSLASVQLMSELAREFQMAMSPSLVFDYPTINALADHLVEESAGA